MSNKVTVCKCTCGKEAVLGEDNIFVCSCGWRFTDWYAKEQEMAITTRDVVDFEPKKEETMEEKKPTPAEQSQIDEVKAGMATKIEEAEKSAQEGDVAGKEDQAK